MLGQRLGVRKWSALVALMAGVSVVQLTKHEQVVSEAASEAAASEAPELASSEQFMGFMAVFAAAVTSGLRRVPATHLAAWWHQHLGA